MPHRTRNRLIIVIQEKGGVAKTFLSVHLTSYLQSRSVLCRPVDFDAPAGLLAKIFPAPHGASINPDIDRLREGTSILPSLMERVLKGERFLVDCGGNTGRTWEFLFTETWPDLPAELAAHDVDLTLVVPVTGAEKCFSSFETYKQQFPFATQIMVVVREFKDDVFPLPEHPANLTIELPLAPKHLFHTYQQRRMAIDSIRTSEDEALKIDRGFALAYLPTLHRAFDRVKEHLI